MGRQYLSKRGNKWQFYRKVPKELVDRIGCRFWRESLRTDSRSLAEHRVVAHIHRTNQLIEEARTGSLSESTIRDFAHAWRWSLPDIGAEGEYGWDGDERREEVARSVRAFAEARKLTVRQPSDWDRLVNQSIRELDDGDLDDGPLPVRDPTH